MRRNYSTFARGHPPGENPLNYESWRIYATDTTARRDSILLLQMEEAYWTLSEKAYWTFGCQVLRRMLFALLYKQAFVELESWLDLNSLPFVQKGGVAT